MDINIAKGFLPRRLRMAIALGFIIVVILGGGVAHAFAEISSTQLYAVNVAGETFGSVYEFDNADAGRKSPDLQAATATNGANGYIRVSEGEALLDKMRAHADLDNDGLCKEQAMELQQAAKDLFGFEALDYDIALNFVYEHGCRELRIVAEDAMRDNLSHNIQLAFGSSQVDFDALSNRISKELQDRHLGKNAFSDGDRVTSEVVALIYDLARERTQLTIPVYESDGVTVIGEFPITVM